MCHTVIANEKIMSVLAKTWSNEGHKDVRHHKHGADCPKTFYNIFHAGKRQLDIFLIHSKTMKK